MASDNEGRVEAVSSETREAVNERARRILDICDVLSDLVARAQAGGFFDVVPYASRILNKLESRLGLR